MFHLLDSFEMLRICAIVEKVARKNVFSVGIWRVVGSVSCMLVQSVLDSVAECATFVSLINCGAFHFVSFLPIPSLPTHSTPHIQFQVIHFIPIPRTRIASSPE